MAINTPPEPTGFTGTTSDQVTPIDWQAVSEIDPTAIWMLGGIMVAFFLFGVLRSIFNFFVSLWIVWTIGMLYQFGIGAIFVNPFFIIGRSFIMAGISWVILVGFMEFTQAPTRIYRKMTR
jgi:hypothetical protein